MTKVTVAICTWNRAALLDKTLEEMRKLRVPAGVEWELLIVNNNCTDATDAVIAKHSSRLPIQRLFEPQQGHSHGRNCALAHATGEVLVFTDDDVLVDPGWLEGYTAALAQWPDATFFGGPVEPWFEVEPPRWLRRQWTICQKAYALRHFGDTTRWLVGDEIPVGANMAFRTAVAKEYAYDPNLGRLQKEVRGGDEDQVFQRLRKDGHRGVWVGNVRVKHWIPRERLTSSYLWQFFYWECRRHTQLDDLLPSTELWGAPRWAFRRYWAALIRYYGWFPFKGERWLKAFHEAIRWKALIDEYRARRRGPADPSEPSEGRPLPVSTGCPS